MSLRKSRALQPRSARAFSAVGFQLDFEMNIEWIYLLDKKWKERLAQWAADLSL